MADYYEILGVSRTASSDEIKKAYRKLAHQHHPDKDGGNEETFKQVNEAYQVLGNESKRQQYDRFGQTFEDAGGSTQGPFGGFNVNFDDLSGFGDLGDMLGQMFGGSRAGTRQTRRGNDIATDIEISFLESARPLTRTVSHRLYQTCTHCRGNGAEPGTPIKTCAVCNGEGTVTRTQQTPLGMFSRRAVCPTCQGEGKQAEKPCTQCRGEGRELRERTLEISIPAGIADGQTIRLAGKGEIPPRGGIPGDAFITVHVAAHPQLRRDGNNVRTSIEVPFTDAALGISQRIETLTGEIDLDVPAGIQPGTELRLPGRGFPHLNGSGQGDQLVTVTVTIPKRLSRKQKNLLLEFKQLQKKKLFG